MWYGWEDRTKSVASKGKLETNPSDILPNEITGTWILYHYNWDQIVALHLDFQQACATLWWLILFVAVQPNITRVNRSYYSALNLVFRGEVVDGDQGSSVLCMTVLNCLRCIRWSLNSPLKHQDVDHCQRQADSTGSSYTAAAGAPSSGSRCAALQSHSFSREGHSPSIVWEVPGQSWHRLPCGAGGKDGTALASPAWQPSPCLFVHIISSTRPNLGSSTSFVFDGWVSSKMLKSQEAFPSGLWLTVEFSMSLSRAAHVSQAADQPSGAGGGGRGFPVPGAGGSHTHSPLEERRRRLTTRKVRATSTFTFTFQSLHNAGIRPYSWEFVLWHCVQDLFPTLLLFWHYKSHSGGSCAGRPKLSELSR